MPYLRKGNTYKTRFTGKAEINKLTFMYIPPTYKRASSIAERRLSNPSYS